MISKEKFVEIINRLKSYNELQDKINNLFKENKEHFKDLEEELKFKKV